MRLWNVYWLAVHAWVIENLIDEMSTITINQIFCILLKKVQGIFFNDQSLFFRLWIWFQQRNSVLSSRTWLISSGSTLSRWRQPANLVIQHHAPPWLRSCLSFSTEWWDTLSANPKQPVMTGIYHKPIATGSYDPIAHDVGYWKIPATTNSLHLLL